MTDIIVSQYSGFCFGVKRAVDLVNKAVSDGSKPIYCLGELIHNSVFIKQLQDSGVSFITEDDLDTLPENALVFIRTHGVTNEVYKKLVSSGVEFVDATCPFVKKIHNIVETQSENTKVIIIGDKNHPEVQGIISFAKGESMVFGTADELKSAFSEDFHSEEPVILAAQTTQNTHEWQMCQKLIKYLYTNAKIFDTICSTTEDRQKELRFNALKSDLTVVIGGRTSSNTAKLFSIAKELCKNALHIETADELLSHKALIKTANTITIAAGASTPSGIIQEVYKQMTDITNEDLSFSEMLDRSFKTLYTGERVTGTVSAVGPAEIKVDLGTKHTGILPYDEVTSDSGVDLTEMFHAGDQIEVICTKFSDADGTVMLSKKRLDQSASWEKIKKCLDDGETLTGTIKEIIKREDGTYAGIIANCDSSKVFIPASQAGVPKGESLEPLMNQKVEFKIIDVDDRRKRAVGSIRMASKTTRKERQDDFYTTAQVGDKFEGKVRAIVDYGAFVSLGPVDGMIHISELSWGRLRPPAEVLEIGQTISVYIKSIDREAKRISLSWKTPENDPWNIFNSKYKVGDVVDATIVSLMPFGAFAEIMPDLDGLIHNSQISDKPVASAASVLKRGDKVTVKITAIDEERHRINLSIKALLEPDEAPVEEAPAEEAPVE